MINLMKKNPAIGPLLLFIGFATILVLAGCGKFTEPYRDAPVDGRNDGPAHVGTMPDGFSNWAAKCDGPNMVYTVYKGDDNRASLSVVANDPRCTGGR